MCAVDLQKNEMTSYTVRVRVLAGRNACLAIGSV